MIIASSAALWLPARAGFNPRRDLYAPIVMRSVAAELTSLRRTTMRTATITPSVVTAMFRVDPEITSPLRDRHSPGRAQFSPANPSREEITAENFANSDAVPMLSAHTYFADEIA